MKAPETIFLSASVPDPRRAPNFAVTANTVAITAAVSSLIHVILGRRPLVWGGHPAITPMIWAVAEGFGVDYGNWVKLYQTRYFADEFPEDNQRFHNVTYTEDIEHDREKSLRVMRERMFTEHQFAAAVFIGGMAGIIDEFEMFRRAQPRALTLPILSTGGAVLDVAKRMETVPRDLTDDLDYIAVFHRHLKVSTQERRFKTPQDQPTSLARRLGKLRMRRKSRR